MFIKLQHEIFNSPFFNFYTEISITHTFGELRDYCSLLDNVRESGGGLFRRLVIQGAFSLAAL